MVFELLGTKNLSDPKHVSCWRPKCVPYLELFYSEPSALVNHDELASLVIKSDHCYEAVPILLETVKQCCKTKCQRQPVKVIGNH